MDNYYSFVFKGLLTEEALDKAGRTNNSLFSETESKEVEKRLGIELMDENLLRNAKKMSIVFIAIYTFENSVRAFISKKLLEEKGVDWWNLSVPEKIRKIAEARKDEEDKIKWHTQRGTGMINYADFTDLLSILYGNWDLFEPHLVTQDWTTQIFKTLVKSRNVIMHSGELSNADIERIGILIRDWYRQTNM